MSGGDFLSFTGCYPKITFLGGAVWSEITGAVCSEFTGAVCSVIVNQATCEYGIVKQTAFETACYAMNFYANIPDEKDKEYFFSQTNKILLKLDSTMNKDFQPFMDTLFNIFPDNELLANTFYTHWKRDIRKFSTASEYDFLFKTIKIIFKYYPHRQDWRLEMNNTVLSMADSMTQRFLDNKGNLSSYIQCYNFLTKARIKLGDFVPNLKNAKYYKVESMGKDFEITSYSGSSGITNTIEFSINYNREITYKITFDAVVPGVEMQNIKGITWKDASNNNKAKKKTDIVQPETFNSLLLDTLTHFYCNKFRAQNKKKPLIWSDLIYKASKHHSMNLAILGCLIHGEESDPIFGQQDSIDYYLSYYTAKRHNSAGENCLYGYWFDKITYDTLAKKIIKQWENSPGHRANMLRDNYSHESISSTISNFSGQLGAFLDYNVAKKYYPELTQLFKVLPELKEKSLKPDVNYFSSQNFIGEN